MTLLQSLAKRGSKNPMFGKKISDLHRKRLSIAHKKYYKEHPEILKRLIRSGRKNGSWVSDKITRVGVHDWIRKIKGDAKNGRCVLRKDGTCRGRLEWSNNTGKYLRRIYDWQILCRSHHSRKDGLYKNGVKTRFKQGQIPWNKKLKK